MEYALDTETKIVLVRFHVMKHVNQAFDTTMRREYRAMVKQGSTGLKGTRYIGLYASGNLPDKYKEKYEELKMFDLLT